MGAESGSDRSASLSVTDNRTGRTYKIPIQNNSVNASDFKQISASRHVLPLIGPEAVDREEDETEGGLRVFDGGFTNTTVLRSAITYINGEEGILRYRGFPIEQLAEKSNFLETAYLVIYGELPTRQQFATFESEILHHSYLHRDSEELISSFRYDSHPMSILTSSFAALGAYAPEANPSLAGQRLYTNAASGDKAALANLDKQIYRLIGKATTLAAMAYRVRQGRPLNRPPLGLSYAGSFLYMLDSLNEHEYKPHPVLENVSGRNGSR